MSGPASAVGELILSSPEERPETPVVATQDALSGHAGAVERRVLPVCWGRLPLRLGGLGLRSAAASAPAAYGLLGLVACPFSGASSLHCSRYAGCCGRRQLVLSRLASPHLAQRAPGLGCCGAAAAPLSERLLGSAARRALESRSHTFAHLQCTRLVNTLVRQQRTLLCADNTLMRQEENKKKKARLLRADREHACAPTRNTFVRQQYSACR